MPHSGRTWKVPDESPFRRPLHPARITALPVRSTPGMGETSRERRCFREGGMTINRRSLFDEISECDAEIAEANERKRAAFDAYREQLAGAGNAKTAVAAEITACKAAFRRLRALDRDADAVLERDALVDEIVAELKTGADRAPRSRASCAREIPRPQDKRATSEGRSITPDSKPSLPAAPPIPEPAVASSPLGPTDGATRPAPAGHSSSQTAGATPSGGEPASRQVSTGNGEIGPVSDPGLPAGSPIPSDDDGSIPSFLRRPLPVEAHP